MAVLGLFRSMLSLLALRVTELHLLEGAWEYVLEFGGPTAAYDQQSSMARSFELTRT